MHPTAFRSPRLSRRRALALAAATVAVAAPGQRSAAQVTPVATPTADLATGTPVPGAASLPTLPMPSTLAADASPEFRAVAEALVAAMREFGVPGAALGMLAGDREEHATFGLVSLSSMRPVTDETLFQIGSLTKTYTGTAIWRLIDEGALDLDAPVRTYIPSLTLMDEEVAAEVTIRNLLDHSAGWYGDEGFDTGDNDDALARYVAERMPHLPQLFPRGEFFSYNNAAFTLLGRLIEVSTGTTYEAALADLLLGPLGLADSLLAHDAVWRRPYADGHVALPINGKPSITVQTPLWLPRSADPAGGLWATTRDVMRYCRFHFDGGTVAGPANVVSPESLLRMREPSMPVPGTAMRMGMDWFVQDVAGERAVFHTGDTLGQHTDFFAIPSQRFAIVILTNGLSGGMAAKAALDATLAQFPALAPMAGQVGITHALVAPADAPTVTLPAETVAEYAGRYADLGTVVTFAEADGRLQMTTESVEQPGVLTAVLNPPPAPPVPVAFLDEDVALVGRQRLPFVRDAEGRVGWVSMGLRLIPRADSDA